MANSAIIVLDTVAGWWITQHNPETYHYLIDTTFIALAALAGLIVNFALLRTAFAPLHGVLATIRAIEQGDLEARVATRQRDADAAALSRAFNGMLDRLALARDENAAWVLRAQEEERRRLALELHDQTGQSLTALALHAEAIAQRLASESSEAAVRARHQAERLTQLTQRTLAEVQALSRQLRPPMLDDLGLPVALRWLGEDAGERLGVTVRVCLRGAATAEDDRLPDDVETTFFRIAQESLTNAVRHGQARQVCITLRRMGARVSLTVRDEGHGFDLAAARAGGRERPRRHGLGLEGMAERARLLGGTLSVRTRPGHGCAVRVVAALPARTAQAGEPAGAMATGAGARGQRMTT
jgi:two-component system sensor histidine kinase UhpB